MTRQKILSHNQRGSVLIVGLFTLALLSLLGAAATTTSRTDISVVGNLKVIQESFYNAEVALAEAEIYLDSLEDKSVLDDETPPGYYPQEEQPAWHALHWDDTDSMVVSLDSEAHVELFERMAARPRFVIEERAFFRDSLVQGKPPTGKYHFNVTGLGVGSNPNTISVLGSIMSRRYH